MAWNPADKGSGIVLSNNNVRAYENGAGDHGVRSVVSHSSGKWYFEIRVVSTTIQNSNLGIASSSCALNVGMISHADSWGMDRFGDLYNNGVKQVDMDFGTWFPGDVYNCAVDLDNDKIWFGEDGTWYNSGDPANGTNPSYDGITSSTTFYVMFSSRGGETVDLRTKSSQFSYARPSGFNPWNGPPLRESGQRKILRPSAMPRPIAHMNR